MMSEKREIEASKWVAYFDRDEISAGVIDVESLSQDYPDFDVWVNASVENRVEFLRLTSAWNRADRLIMVGGDNVVPIGFRKLPIGFRKLWSRFGEKGVIAASIIAVFMISITFNIPTSHDSVIRQGNGDNVVASYPEESRHIVTETGDVEQIMLSDGTDVKVNTNSDLTTASTDQIRLVTLNKGEAFFDVVHDPERPFVVEVGGKIVQAVGTQFSVYYEDGKFEVQVLEGAVKVFEGTAKDVIANSALESNFIELVKGGVAVSVDSHVMTTKGTEQRVESALDWRNGFLSFDDMALKDVAEEFNRYNDLKLVIVGQETSNIRIGGRFVATNAEGFAQLLENEFELSLYRSDNLIKISQ